MVSKQYLPMVKYGTASQLLFIISTYKYKNTIFSWIMGLSNKYMSARQSCVVNFVQGPQKYSYSKQRSNLSVIPTEIHKFW